MEIFQIVLLLTAVTTNILVDSSPNVCPSVCDCSKHLYTASCKEGKLGRIPWNLPDPFGLKELDMRGNEMHSLTSQIEFYPNLEMLDLSDNNIILIGDQVFVGLKKMKKLLLRNNGIKTIRPLAFQGLHSLRVLDLSGNQIETLQKEVFLDLQVLEELNLGSNRLKELPQHFFRNLVNLRYLTLTDNNLQMFPSLDGMMNLNFLSLDMNHIKRIPSSVFRFSSDIQLLNLDGNLISEIVNDAFNTPQGCAKIRRLSMQNNRLAKIPTDVMSCLEYTELLDLSGNLIKSLSDTDFKGVQRLRTLILSNLPNLKAIRNGTFSKQHALRELVAHSNRQLSIIEYGSFGSDISLRRLDLHGNALESLDRDLLSWHDLEFLDLRYNRWRCDCHLQWLQDVLINIASNHTQQLLRETQCSHPARLSSVSIADLSGTDLSCSGKGGKDLLQQREMEDKILIGLLGGICSALFVIMVFVLCKCRSSFLNSPHGMYPYITFTEMSRQSGIHASSHSPQLQQQVVRANQQMSKSKRETEIPSAETEKTSTVRFNTDDSG